MDEVLLLLLIILEADEVETVIRRGSQRTL